jgi:hypothetical protein
LIFEFWPSEFRDNKCLWLQLVIICYRSPGNRKKGSMLPLMKTPEGRMERMDEGHEYKINS